MILLGSIRKLLMRRLRLTTYLWHWIIRRCTSIAMQCVDVSVDKKVEFVPIVNTSKKDSGFTILKYEFYI
jgi:hypothetical protein